MLDLAEINLPFLDEPHHPKLGRYTKPHTLAWSREIDTADALVIVTPEYNSGFPAPLKNAIDFLHAEWKNKALGMVTYGGGASGGARAGRMLQPVTTALGLVTAEHAVAISGAAGQVVAGEFVPTAADDASAIAMLTELAEIEAELRPVRGAAGPGRLSYPVAPIAGPHCRSSAPSITAAVDHWHAGRVPIDLDQLSPGVLEFLSERHLATLTTLRGDGSPHVVAVGFTFDPQSRIARVITSDGTVKVRNAERPGTDGARSGRPSARSTAGAGSPSRGSLRSVGIAPRSPTPSSDTGRGTGYRGSIRAGWC